jgi:hypothetical protein
MADVLRVFVSAAAAVVVLCGCTGPSAPHASPSASEAQTASPSISEAPAVPALASLTCGEPIDGGPVPAGWQVVLGVVALPTSPGSPALQAADDRDPTLPTLFAKTGLLVRAGHPFELDVPEAGSNRIGLGWGNALAFRPSARFAVPSCPDQYGTGWVSYPGGYWVDRPLCLPLTVRAAGRAQQVHIGIGTPCPGQQAPASP